MEVNEFYTEWYTNIKRQIKVNGWERVIDPSFVNSNVRPGSDHNLLELQLVFMSMVLEKVPLNRNGKKLNRFYKNHPQTLWKLHQEHKTSTTRGQGIAINLSNKLSGLTITNSKSRSNFLEEFDSTSEKHDLVAVDKMPSSHKICLLKKAIIADNALLQA